MGIKRRPIAPMPPHINPKLLTGQTYEVKQARTPAYQEYVGSIFTYSESQKIIVWLGEGLHSMGGYDAASVLNHHGIEFEQVNLQVV